MVLTNEATVTLLTAPELRAVLAHEIGHLRRGARAVGLLRLGSVLALYANYSLTTLLNWPLMEVEADRFAVSVAGSPEALKSGLTKLAVGSIVTAAATDQQGLRTHGGASSVRMGVEFFLGEGLLGSVHPFLSERLAALDEMERTVDG